MANWAKANPGTAAMAVGGTALAALVASRLLANRDDDDDDDKRAAARLTYAATKAAADLPPVRRIPWTKLASLLRQGTPLDAAVAGAFPALPHANRLKLAAHLRRAADKLANSQMGYGGGGVGGGVPSMGPQSFTGPVAGGMNFMSGQLGF